MLEKLLKCGIAGGVVLFLWGMMAWTVLPWHQIQMKKFEDESKVAHVIKDNASESGIYVLPNMRGIPKNSEEMDEARESMRQGPFVFAAVSLEGMKPNKAIPMVKGFVLKIISAIIVTWMVMQTKLNYNKRVGFITMIGLLIGLLSTIPEVIWVGFPLGFSLALMFEVIFGWFFAGLVIAKLVK